MDQVAVTFLMPSVISRLEIPLQPPDNTPERLHPKDQCPSSFRRWPVEGRGWGIRATTSVTHRAQSSGASQHWWDKVDDGGLRYAIVFSGREHTCITRSNSVGNEDEVQQLRGEGVVEVEVQVTGAALIFGRDEAEVDQPVHVAQCR